MGRKAVGPRYWNRKGGGYFCVFRGTEHELALGPKDEPSGPTYLAALDAFKKVMEGGTPEPPRTASPTIREVLEAYLKHVNKTKEPGTVEIRLRSFTPFVNHPVKGGLLGEREVASLKHQDVYDFLEHMETVPRARVRKKEQKGRKPTAWGPGSQRNFVRGVVAAFNWAVTGKMIDENPLHRISKPGAVSRGADGRGPRRKPRGKERPPEDRKYNRAFRRRRIVVEHAIGRLRRFRAVAHVNRHQRHGHAMRVRAIAGLVNRMLDYRAAT